MPPPSNHSAQQANAQPFQFDLKTLFWLMGAVAVFCFLWRWQRVFPYWTILPGLFLLAAWFVANRKRSPDLAWGLFAIGWCLCLINTMTGLLNSLMMMGGPPPTEEMQDRFLSAYTSSIMLPLCLTFPIVLLATEASRGSHSFARKWLVICPMLGLLNVTLLILFMVVWFGLTWPWINGVN